MDRLNCDYLTGLYNRQELHNFYNNMNDGSLFHFMFIDIDNFKNVNDVYGHNEGDVLLIKIAGILKSSAPDAHIIRLGGDEFCLIFVGELKREKLCEIAESIIQRIVNKEGFLHISTLLSASVGILYNETKNSTLDDILLKSDIAMYYAKEHGKGRYIVFNEIEERVLNEIEMEKRQQQALDNKEFEIRYLPVINPQTSKIKISWVKLYWNMPNGRVVAQDEFLSLFEKNGFIRQILNYVFINVLEHLKKYHEVKQVVGKVGIRVSRLILLDNEFPHILERLVKEYGVEPFELELGVDERSFRRGEEGILDNMRVLKEKGFSVSVIGVGSEFKSIGYLDKIQFNSIMFDSDYVNNALKSERGRQIIKSLFSMVRDLKMNVITEGILTKEDAVFLNRCGCNAVSGSIYSAPLKLEQYGEFVNNKIVQKDENVVFRFWDDLYSSDKRYEGRVLGEGITFEKGISDNWGALLFPGGGINENVVELPNAILSESSYTIGMWLKPLAEISWTSTFYARYKGRFCSFSPYVIGGNSVYRVAEDAEFNGFHDAFVRHIPKGVWSFVCLTYDEFGSVIRMYINGRKAGVKEDILVLAACRQILIGGDPFQPSYEGYVSGLCFYEYVKSEDEIKELYNEFCAEKGFCGECEAFWME